MLTFISGWRSPDRDQVLVNQRDTSRTTLYFIDNASTLPVVMPDTPIIDVWRNGRMELPLDPNTTTIIRVNYDTDNELIGRAVTHALMQHTDGQIIVMFDALNALYRLFPALREGSALLASDARLEADKGDHVIFTRGGSFVWKDHLLELRTAVLTDAECLDMGILDLELMHLDY